MYIARKTLREFSKDQCTDLAAALTYYEVLALFPAAIALLSLVPIWKLRPVMLLVTLVLVVLAAVALLALVVSGPLTQSLGDALGLGSAVVLAWRIA